MTSYTASSSLNAQLSQLDLVFMTTGCRELLLLSMTVSMGMLIFAGLGYALEKDEPDTMFYTLPQVGKMFKPSSIQSH